MEKQSRAWLPTNSVRSIVLHSAVLFVLCIVPAISDSYTINLLTQVLIFAIFAMSLNVIVGHTGLVSLGHSTFFGVGAYTAGILSVKGLDNFWLTLPLGTVAAIGIGLLFGLLVVRSSGPYFLLITLALGQLVYAVAWHWREVTGGDDGLPGISRPDLGIPVSMWDTSSYYYLTLILFILAFVLLCLVVNSRFGTALKGIKDAENRMTVLGYNTWAYKYVAYVLSGGFGGFAGVLYAYYNGFVSPDDLSWVVSGFGLLMVIIGGTGSLYGPIIGAAIILLLQHIVSSYTENWSLVMGLVFIFCVMFVKKGVCGYLESKLGDLVKNATSENR